MLVLGFKHFTFKKNSKLNDVDRLVGSILQTKFTRDEVIAASVLYRILNKKEKDEKILLE